jgi:hypothetical protein
MYRSTGGCPSTCPRSKNRNKAGLYVTHKSVARDGARTIISCRYTETKFNTLFKLTAVGSGRPAHNAKLGMPGMV